MCYPNIELERMRINMTRAEIADYLGVQKDVYMTWVKGEYPIPLHFLYRLSDLFRCSVDYLLSDSDVAYKWRGYRRI